MSSEISKAPHIDAVSGQAAWILAQTIGMMLVNNGVIPKVDLRESLAVAQRSVLQGQNVPPAQKAAAVLLEQYRTLLHTADNSDAN